MARPKTPLISKDVAVKAALTIIDDEGIEALSIRRLGQALGVNGASLYHHFRDKEEILDGVRHLVLAEVRVPVEPDVTWQEFCVDAARNMRQALLSHPNAAPLMSYNHSRSRGRLTRDFAAGLLLKAGVPSDMVYPLFESLEVISFGAAMINPDQKDAADIFGDLDERHANLRVAIEADRRGGRERFELQCQALVAGWEVVIGAAGAGEKAPSPARSSHRTGLRKTNQRSIM